MAPLINCMALEVRRQELYTPENVGGITGSNLDLKNCRKPKIIEWVNIQEFTDMRVDACKP